MSAPFGRPTGLWNDNEIMFDPFPNISSLVYGPTGSHKTITQVITTCQGLLADTELSQVYNDFKDSEIISQIAPMCNKYGRKVGCTDEFRTLGEDCPYRHILNPFWAIDAAAETNPADLSFVIRGVTFAIIPEPPNDLAQ